MRCLLLALFAAVALSQSCSNSVSFGSLPVTVNGVTEYMALSKSYGNGPTISGTQMTAPQGWRAALATGCPTAKSPTMFRKFTLLGASLGFTLNLGGISCGCNFAVYFVKMPAYNSNGQTVPGSNNDYYCDANKVDGTFCPEIDLVEANSRGFQVTPHSCSAPSNHYYSSCDTGGCARNAVRQDGTNAYGSGSGFTIDTSQAFNVNFTFVKNSANQWSQWITTFTQGSHKITLTHDPSVCGSSYLSGMTTDLTDGFTLVFSHWSGDVSWLDNPPCTSESCNSGTAYFSNMWYNTGSYTPPASSASPRSSSAAVRSSSKATPQSSTAVRSSSKATPQSSTAVRSSSAAVRSSSAAGTALCGTYNCKATGCKTCTSWTPGWCSESQTNCETNCNGKWCAAGTYTATADDEPAENTPVGGATAAAVSVAATATALAAALL